MNIDELLRHTVERGASDLHLKVGNVPFVRIDGELQPTTFDRLSAEDTASFANAVMPEHKRREFSETNESDIGYTLGGVGRFRINVYRRNDDGTLEILLASRRTRRGDLAWGLAKGGIEAGETNEDAALREVREETGIVAEIEEPLGETKYIYVWEDVRIRKTVHFFLMRATGGDPDDRDDEMEEIRSFPMERALKRAAYRGEREVLNRAAELLGS